MNTAERAKAVANVSKYNDQFYIRRPDGTMEHVNCVEEMKRLARQVVVLSKALEKVVWYDDNTYEEGECSVALETSGDIARQALKQAEEV